MKKIISVQTKNFSCVAAYSVLESDQRALTKRLIGGTLVGGGLGAFIQTLVYPFTDPIITAVQTQGMTTQEALKKYLPEMKKKPFKFYAGFSYILMATIPRRVAIFLPREMGSLMAQQRDLPFRYGMYGGIALGAVLETLCWNPAEFLKTQAQGVQLFGNPPLIESPHSSSKCNSIGLSGR